MKIALISDIHSNVLALDAGISDVKRVGVDQIFNLGDILYGPLWPYETFNLLKSIEAVTIQGNQDREIYEAESADLERHPILRFASRDLAEEGTAWLKTLPKTKRVGDVLLCHGTPQSDMIYLLEDVKNGSPNLRHDTETEELLGDCRAPVIVCGHTHTPRAIRLATGQIIVNPGSVGLPAYDDELPNKHLMQTGSPDASYAVLEKIDGRWAVQLRKVPYNFDLAAKRARELKSAGANQWAGWLETGRAN